MKVWLYNKRYNEASDAETFDGCTAQDAVLQMAQKRPNDDHCTWVVRFDDGHLELWTSNPHLVIDVSKGQDVDESDIYHEV